MHVADADHMTVTPDELLDPARLDTLARTIRRDAAAPARGFLASTTTVYLTAADESGMMISYIQSNYSGFGSGVVVPGTGIALNNRGSCFVTGARPPQPRRPVQAPAQHHHPRLPHQGRPAGSRASA